MISSNYTNAGWGGDIPGWVPQRALRVVAATTSYSLDDCAVRIGVECTMEGTTEGTPKETDRLEIYT